MSYVNFNRQKDQAFAASSSADSNTIYFTTDTNQIYIGGLNYGKILDYVSQEVYTEDTKVISAALNNLNSRLLDIPTEFNYLPLSGGTMSGGINWMANGTEFQSLLTIEATDAIGFNGTDGYMVLNNAGQLGGIRINGILDLDCSATFLRPATFNTWSTFKEGLRVDVNQYINFGGVSSISEIDNENESKFDIYSDYPIVLTASDLNETTLILNDDGANFNCGVYASAFYETSDIRCKEIKGELNLEKCYNLIDKCQDIIYNLKGHTELEIGLIAQEVEKFFPEVVREQGGVKTLDYSRLVVICFKVLKDVIKRLEKLEA